MDVDGLKKLLTGIESGAIRIVACDLTEPSPLALEVLSARPYAYLDDAPLEERRTQAVMSRRWLDTEAASDIGRLDDEAIAKVRAESWPEAANPDELHDGLSWLGFLTDEEVSAQSEWCVWLEQLAAQNRVLRIKSQKLWIATERLPHFLALWPALQSHPEMPPAGESEQPSGGESLVEILRGRLEGTRSCHGSRARPAFRCCLSRDRRRSRRTGKRRICASWPVHARRDAGGVVRTAIARPYSSVHDQSVARGN